MSLTDDLMTYFLEARERGLTSFQIALLLQTSSPTREMSRLRKKYQNTLKFPHTVEQGRGRRWYRFFLDDYAPKNAIWGDKNEKAEDAA